MTSRSLLRYLISSLICCPLPYSFSQYYDTPNKGYLSYEFCWQITSYEQIRKLRSELLTNYTISKLMVTLGTLQSGLTLKFLHHVHRLYLYVLYGSNKRRLFLCITTAFLSGNREGVSLLRGTDWTFQHNLD